MAEKVIPVDIKTGIPFVLEPCYEAPSCLRPIVGKYDLHHPYPKSLFKDVPGIELHAARVQYVNYGDHRDYHNYFDGYLANEWQLPISKLDRLGAVVLLTAGYIPESAIRLDRNGPEYVPLSEGERQYMRDSGIIRVESESMVYKFLKSVVLSQPIDIEDIAVQEFVFSPDEQLRLRRGNELLACAAEIATEPIRDIYRKAYIGRLITAELPQEPRDCLLASPVMLGTEKRRRRARTSLRVRLAGTMGVELADVA